MKRKITWVEDSASVAKLSAGFSLFFFTYPGTIIALQMKKCRIARHNLTNICSQTLLSFCGVFAGGGIVSLLDYTAQACTDCNLFHITLTSLRRSPRLL